MQRWIHGHRIVTGDPEELIGRLRSELPELLARAVHQSPNPPLGDGSFLIELPIHLAGLDVGKHVRVHVGAERGLTGRLILPVRCYAEPLTHLFPTFDGAIEFESLSTHRAQVSLVGSYTPPVGPLGAAVDAAFHRVIEHTSSALLEGLANALTDGSPTPAAPLDSALVHVGDVMTRNPVQLEEQMSLRTAALVLVHLEIAGAPVVDAEGRLVGVLSERDLLEKEATHRFGLGAKVRRSERLRAARTVGDACSRPPHVTAPETTVHDAAREMLNRDVSRLVVLDGGQIVGILARRDVLKVLARDDLATLEAARRALRDLGERNVRVEVEWGCLTATGTVSLRSRVGQVVEHLEAVDGVMGVGVEGLTWELDDVSVITV